MGLFDRFRRNSSQVDDYYDLFATWLDKVLEQDLPKGIIAFNFNLYEGSDETYNVQLIGSDEFSENDEDWVCTDYFTTGEDICYIRRTKEIEDWEKGLSYLTKLAQRYIAEGKKSDILKSASAVAIGFVDGDISIIYRA
jgi:hypothetical protein